MPSPAAGEDLFKLAPLLRIAARLDRITAAMERNEHGYNVRLLADDDDRRLIQRFFARAVIELVVAKSH
jgi:hypothetical protein